MVNSRQCQWLFLLVCGLFLLKTESFLVVPVIRVEWAKEKGAVCLDGTAPAYALDYGTGDGANKWIIFLEGGGWCNSPADCFSRSNTDMGSSKQWDNRKSSMVGILSNEEKSNPYFHHWNRVYVRYCDGSSYSGDVEQPYKEKDHPVYFRGKRVFDAVIQDLLGKGLKNASHALLAGCSAGGLGAMLRCDTFRSLLPTSTKVKCASDAGFFIDAADVYGGHYFRGWYAQVVATHGAKYLPESCKSKMNASLCMFPENFVADIQTPLFLINSAFDFWQIQNIKVPNLKDSNPQHQDRYLKFLPCRKDIELCTCDQAKAWRDYEGEFNTALSKLGKSPSYFITACNSHCHTQNEEKWVGEATKIDNMGMADALSKWIHDDVTFRKKDDIHKTPIVCAYDTGEPNVNNNYTWGGLPINAHFTTKDEIARKSKLVSLCPEQIPCYGASIAAAKQCPAPAV